MAKRDCTLSQKRLKELLSYNPDTGEFVWVNVTTNRVKVGSVAGSEHYHGYIIIGIDGIPYRAHHLAFLWMTGHLPSDHVDHINQVKADNRWSNLRVLGHAGNQRNRRGKKGWFYKPGQPKPYHARIYTNGRRIFLGTFRTSREAEAAYIKAKKKYHHEYVHQAAA